MLKIKFKNYKLPVIFLSAIITVAAGFLIVLASTATWNPSSAPGDTMKNLEQIYCKITGCTVTTYGLDSPGIPGPTMYTIEQVYTATPDFRVAPLDNNNILPGDVCGGKEFYTDSSTKQTGTRTYCSAARTQGQACNHADQCLSGLCTDGVCCSVASCGQCQACQLVSGNCGASPNSNWGSNLYACIGSTSRCLSGDCKTCGGKVAIDGCSGCSGVADSNNMVCWRKGAAGQTCTVVCSAQGQGGCIAQPWADPNCVLMKSWGYPSSSCNPGSCGSSSPCLGAYGCGVTLYAGPNTNCSYIYHSGVVRFCVCAGQQ